MSGLLGGVLPTEDAIASKLSDGGVQMSSPPDTSVTSTSIYEDSVIPVISDRFALDGQGPCIDDGYADVSSSCENLLSGITCCASPLFESHADESMANVEDIDNIQATLSPLDGLLLADLTGCDTGDVVNNRLYLPDFCGNHGDCSLGFLGSPVGSKSHDCPIGYETLTAANNSLLSLAQSIQPISSSFLDSWQDGYSDELSSTTFVPNSMFVDQSQAAVNEHPVRKVHENLLASHMERHELEYTSGITKLDESDQNNFFESVAAMDFQALSNSAASMNGSQSTASLDAPFDLVDSNPETSLILTFDSTMPIPASMEFCASSPLACTNGSALGDSMNVSDLDNQQLQEFLQSTELSHDIVLAAAEHVGQSALMLVGEAPSVNTLDDLPLIDLHSVSENCQQRSPVFDDENFDLDDSDWTYVQNYSSSEVHTPSIDNANEAKQAGRGKKFKMDRSSKRDLRRSSRIQDYELRDLAQKIREENQLKERLETEMQGLMGKSPVTRAESPKLKLLSCEVELQRVESPNLHKTQQLADLKRKCDDSEAPTNNHKTQKNSHIEYVDDSATETEDTESMSTRGEVEGQARKVPHKKRQKSDSKFRSYSVMLSVNEAADGSPHPGKLKLKLRKIKDNGENSSPEMLLDTRRSSSDDHVSEALKVNEESCSAMSTIVANSSEPTEDKAVRRAGIETLLDNASGYGNSLAVNKIPEDNGTPGVVTKNSKVKKVGIVKPVQKEIELTTSLDFETTSEWSPSVMDSSKPEGSKSADDMSDGSFAERPAKKSVCDEVSDTRQRSKQCSQDNSAVGNEINEIRSSHKSKSSKSSDRKDNKLHKKKDVISLDELREISTSAKAPLLYAGSSQFLMAEKDSSTKAKVRRTTKAVGVISNDKHINDKDKKAARDPVVEKCKGAMQCRGRGCQKLITTQSVYCGDSCLQLHVAESIALLSTESKHPSQTDKESTKKNAREDERIVVFERSTGKLVTGLHAPTPTTLLPWIRKHPTFEVVQSSPGSKTLKNKSHKTRSPAISYSSSSVKEARVESIATDGGVKKTKVVRPDKDHHPDKDRSSKHTVEKTDPRSSSSRNDTSAEVSRLASSVDKKRTAETVGRSASVKETDETLLSTRQITDEQKRKTKDDEKDEKKKESKDAARNHVRKGFYRALMARVPELTDSSAFEAAQLKRLSEKVEEELWKYYGGVNSLYQRKYRALVSHLTDGNNQGLFRRVIYGYLKPLELVQINSQLLGSERWSKMPAERSSGGSVLANIPAKVPPSKRLEVTSSSSVHASTSKTVTSVAGMKRKVESVPIVNIDTTSRHGQHLFDVYCKICTGSAETADVKPKPSVSDDRIHPVKEENSAIAKPSLTTLQSVVGPFHSTSNELPSRTTLPDVNRMKFTSARVTSQAILPDFSHLYSLSSEITSRKMAPDVSHSDSISNEAPPRAAKPDVCHLQLASSDSSETTAAHSANIASAPSVPTWLSPSPKLGSRQDRGSTAVMDKFKAKSSATPSSPVESSLSQFPQLSPPAPLLERSAIDEVVWSGSLVAQDIATIKATAHRVSGSMKIMKNELTESLTVVGRIPPDIVCDYLNKIKRAPVITREIAVVFFTPHRDESDVERYDQLFKYLIERHRCAAFGSIGDSIKDMYIWPLARDSVVPSVLLPFTRPGLPANRKDLLLGVVVQHLSSRYHPKRILPPQPVSEPSLIPLTSKEEVEFSSVEKVEQDNCSANDEEAVTGVLDQPAEEHEDISEPAQIPVTSIVPLCNTRVDNGDEPYEPVDEEASWPPSAESSGAIVSKISPIEAVSTENRLLAALGDRSEVERFTTCIDKLLKIAKNKTDDAFIAEELNQKQQLLMQLNGLIRRRIQSQELLSEQASSSESVIASSRLEPKPMNSTRTVEECSSSSCPGTAAGNASDGSETEMDKFLAWKSRLEGLDCGKSSSSELDGKVSSVDQKAAFDVSSRYHINAMTDTDSRAEENSDNELMASVGMSAAVLEQPVPSRDAVVGLLAGSVSHGKSEEGLRPAFSRESTLVTSRSGNATNNSTINEAHCADASCVISPINSPTTPDAVSRSSSENSSLFNFPPLSTPPKPPENLLKINFDQCCGVSLMPPAFPVLRDTSWRMLDTLSSHHREFIADRQPDNTVPFSPASPPSELLYGDADCDGLSVNREDNLSMSISTSVPVLSRPPPFPYLLASPLSNTSSVENLSSPGDADPIVMSVNPPLKSDFELMTNDLSRLPPAAALLESSGVEKARAPVGQYSLSIFSQSQKEHLRQTIPREVNSFENRFLDFKPSEPQRKNGVQQDSMFDEVQASRVTHTVGSRSDKSRNFAGASALEEDSSLCCDLYGAAYSSHSADLFTSGKSLLLTASSYPESEQRIGALSVEVEVRKKNQSVGDRQTTKDDRSCRFDGSQFGEVSMKSSVSTIVLQEPEDSSEDEQPVPETERDILATKIHSDALIYESGDSCTNKSEHNQDLSTKDSQESTKWFGDGTSCNTSSSDDEAVVSESALQKGSRVRLKERTKLRKGEGDCYRDDVSKNKMNSSKGLSIESDHDAIQLSHVSHQRSTHVLDVPDYLPAPPRVRDRSTKLVSPRESLRYVKPRSISEAVHKHNPGSAYLGCFSSRDNHNAGIGQSHDRTSSKSAYSRDNYDAPRPRSDLSPRGNFKSKPSTVSVVEDSRMLGSRPQEHRVSKLESSNQLTGQDKSLGTWFEPRHLSSGPAKTKPKGLSFSVDETFDEPSEESPVKHANQSSCHTRRNASDGHRSYRRCSKEFELDSVTEPDKVRAAASTKVEAGHRNECSVDELEDGEIVDSNDESPPCSPVSNKLLPPPKVSVPLRSSRDGNPPLPGSTTKIDTSRRSSTWYSRKSHQSSNFF